MLVADQVKQDLAGMVNMSAVYASELLLQAQKNRIQLAADISSIEDEGRITKVSELAEW